MKRAVVLGGAGFIGGHMCRYLKDLGYWVRAVDHVDPRYGDVPCDDYDWYCDLRRKDNVLSALDGNIDEIYQFAANMGGMGWISGHNLEILHDNSLINVNIAARVATLGTPRLFFSSSACVYPEDYQDRLPAEHSMYDERTYNLAEDDAWKGKPDTAYGIEKLFAEEVFLHLGRETDAEVRMARYHNIFGPQGSWNDGREKLPAAACCKIAMEVVAWKRQRPGKEMPAFGIDIWGDGEQVRSFCYIEDCLEMTYRLMHSDYDKPLNIGSHHAVTVNEVYDIVADIAGVELVRVHDLSKPQGVRARNMDRELMLFVLGYELQYSLREGLEKRERNRETMIQKRFGQLTGEEENLPW